MILIFPKYYIHNEISVKNSNKILVEINTLIITYFYGKIRCAEKLKMKKKKKAGGLRTIDFTTYCKTAIIQTK